MQSSFTSFSPKMFRPTDLGYFQNLDPVSGPGPWTQTQKNLDLKKPGPRKTWILKNLDSKNPWPWKTWTLKNLYPEKPVPWKNLDYEKRGKQLDVKKR